MDLKKFKRKVAEIDEKIVEIDKMVPKDMWIELPSHSQYWRYFDYFGLYMIFGKDEILYIGISTNIYSRLKAHIIDDRFRGNEKVHKIKIKISSSQQDLYKSDSFLEYLEKRLIFKLRPKYNKQIISKDLLRFSVARPRYSNHIKYKNLENPA